MTKAFNVVPTQHKSVIRFLARGRIGILFYLSCISISAIQAQTRLVINGGTINISQGACLVIDNPASNGITRSSGAILSEGEDNRVKWNVGTTSGTYTIPWGYGTTDYIPLTFTKTAGSGNGYFLFSTYHTSWQNSTQLPTTVSNMNGAAGTDNSLFISDRFWQINALGYRTKPALSNLVFTYLDKENAPPNTIAEEGLIAKRYSTNRASWIDNILVRTINTTANTVTVTSVNSSNLFPWWTLGTLGTIRYWVAPYNSNSNVSSNWSQTSGGAGNAGVPSAQDIVIIDGASEANITLNSDLNVAELQVNAGYTGTIKQGTSMITVGSAATFSGGVFLGGSSNINVSGPFTIAGSSFTSTSAILDLKGDFTVTSGHFLHNMGTVNFSGATSGLSQNISGYEVSNFNNINVTNSAASPGVSVESDQNLRGVLTLANNVTFDADGSSNNAIFKLISSGDFPTMDASVAELPSNATVVGNITVQRYMSIEGGNNTNIYRYISSPVQNASVADLQNEIPVVGPFAGSSNCPACGTAQSLFSYDETVITDTNHDGIIDLADGYVGFPVASNTETFVPGLGYALYVNGSLLTTALWDLRGTLTTGNVPLPVTFTHSTNPTSDGWNLVGNPYASTIDWNAKGWKKKNLESAVYVRANGGNKTKYSTWNGVTGTNGGSQLIPTGQAFWTKADGHGTPVLEANENVKVAGTQTVFLRTNAPDNLLRITMQNDSVWDDAVIHFRVDATESFDPGADALKLNNSSFNLSTVQLDGQKLAINSVFAVGCKSEIPLNIENADPGNFALRFEGQTSFSDLVALTFKDHFTGDSLDVRSGGNYSFSITTDPGSSRPDRFSMVFATPPLSSGFGVTAANLCPGADAQIQIDNSQPGASYVAISNYGPMSPSMIGDGTTINLSVPADSLVSGQNTLRVTSSWNDCALLIEKSTVCSVESKFGLTTLAGKVCRTGPISLGALGSPNGGYYNWYESALDSVPVANQHDSIFTTPSLTQSLTYYASIVSSSGCEGIRQPVVAEVVQYADAVIVASGGDSLRSNFSNGNQWLFNQEIIPGATKQSIKPEWSGTYSVEVSISDCVTSADLQFVVTAIELPEKKNMAVYPNPVVREVHIQIPVSLRNIQSVSVLNILGEPIGIIDLQLNQGFKSGSFELTNYPAGIYILQVIAADKIVEMKIIKL